MSSLRDKLTATIHAYAYSYHYMPTNNLALTNNKLIVFFQASHKHWVPTSNHNLWNRWSVIMNDFVHIPHFHHICKLSLGWEEAEVACYVYWDTVLPQKGLKATTLWKQLQQNNWNGLVSDTLKISISQSLLSFWLTTLSYACHNRLTLILNTWNNYV